MLSLNSMVRISSNEVNEMVRHCLEENPNEACGLLIGVGDEITFVRRARSQRPSPYEFTMEPMDILAIDREAETNDMGIVGLYHCHTMTDAFPSPTDVAASPDENWFHFLISLKRKPYQVRAFKIVGRSIDGVEIVLTDLKDGLIEAQWSL